MMSCFARYDFIASAILPCATSTSPIVLPAGDAGVGLGQSVGNGEPVAERFQRNPASASASVPAAVAASPNPIHPSMLSGSRDVASRCQRHAKMALRRRHPRRPSRPHRPAIVRKRSCRRAPSFLIALEHKSRIFVKSGAKLSAFDLTGSETATHRAVVIKAEMPTEHSVSCHAFREAVPLDRQRGISQLS
jgi:hypothetical protein